MNRLFIVTFLALTIAFFGCGGETQNDTPDSQPTAPAPVDNSGYASKPMPAGNSPYADVLTFNYWVFEKYYHPDKARKDMGKGRWFKFEKDGSFVSGRWKDQTASGSWRTYTREGKIFILIDSTNNSEDAEFEIQAITQEQDQMAWVGTPAYPNFDPVSLVTSNLMTIPTKAQFGVE